MPKKPLRLLKIMILILKEEVSMLKLQRKNVQAAELEEEKTQMTAVNAGKKEMEKQEAIIVDLGEDVPILKAHLDRKKARKEENEQDKKKRQKAAFFMTYIL